MKNIRNIWCGVVAAETVVVVVAAVEVVAVAVMVDTHDGSVFVSKMSKHGVSPREGLVTNDAKYDDQLLKVRSSSYKVSVSCKLSSS
jgi:hypothetical protein